MSKSDQLRSIPSAPVIVRLRQKRSIASPERSLGKRPNLGCSTHRPAIPKPVIHSAAVDWRNLWGVIAFPDLCS